MSLSPETVKKFQERMEQIIEEHGHFVQGVSDGPDSYAYTIGRNDRPAPEFFIEGSSKEIMSLLNTVPPLYDKGYIAIGTAFNLNGWKTRTAGEPTLFLLDHCSREEIDMMIGAKSRASRKGQELVGPIKIIVAGADNKFPAGYEDGYPKGNLFSFRAECQSDASRVMEFVAFDKMRVKRPAKGLPDVEVEFTTELSREEVLERISEIDQDIHVILDTLREGPLDNNPLLRPGASFIFTGQEAKRIYEENHCPAFTTLPDFYARFKTLVYNGAYEAQVYFDSRSCQETAVAELIANGFGVEDQGDGSVNVTFKG